MKMTQLTSTKSRDLKMKSALIIVSLFAVAFARPEPPSSYGAPSQASSSSYGVPSQEYGGQQGGQTYRHVYVHSAPDEATEVANRVIRVPGGGNKHVNIVFVKTPSTSSHSNTEVILPEQPEQKTVVYVLLRKGSNTNDVKVRQPGSPAIQKPEVFFIRYKDQQQQQGAYGAPAPVEQPSGQYGSPY